MSHQAALRYVRKSRSLIVAASLSALAAMMTAAPVPGPSRAFAQSPSAGRSKNPASRFDGIWMKTGLDFDYVDNQRDLVLPKIAAQLDKMKPQDMPGQSCVERGLLGFMLGDDPTRIVAFDNELLMVGSADHIVRHIRFDLKEHDPDPVLTFYGENIVHWEGDTMVVDDRALNTQNFLGRTGARLGPNMHVIEHWRLRDKNHIEMWFHFDDATAYKHPFDSKHFIWVRQPANTTFDEAICTENNRLDPHNPNNNPAFTTYDGPIEPPPDLRSLGVDPSQIPAGFGPTKGPPPGQ